nr:hypothetical protein [Tanacetum cinerariifolium]
HEGYFGHAGPAMAAHVAGHFAAAHREAHQRHVLQVERVEHGLQVVGQRVVVVALKGLGRIAEAAAGVSHHAQAVLGQLAQLVGPGLVALGPAVDEHHHGPLALVGVVQLDVFAVGVLAGLDVAHGIGKMGNDGKWMIRHQLGALGRRDDVERVRGRFAAFGIEQFVEAVHRVIVQENRLAGQVQQQGQRVAARAAAGAGIHHHHLVIEGAGRILDGRERGFSLGNDFRRVAGPDNVHRHQLRLHGLPLIGAVARGAVLRHEQCPAAGHQRGTAYHALRGLQAVDVGLQVAQLLLIHPLAGGRGRLTGLAFERGR